ncbi:hypothetical protein [Egicoccus sp. AB-alg6-2]
MSTRRFSVLLTGLSTGATWRQAARDDLRALQNPAEAEAAFLAAFGG